jgi:hypothetical protein
MSGLDKYLGKKFSELFKGKDNRFLVKPNQFGDRIVDIDDIVNAFPQSLTGLINTAASNYILTSSEIGILEESSV